MTEMSQLHQKYEDLQKESTEIMHTLSANLEASERQCQELLESDTISELSLLRLQVPRLEEEISKLEKLNSSLKEKAGNLKKKLEEVLPAGSVLCIEHDKKVKKLQNELMELKAKLYDVTELLKSSSANEEKLYEDNKNLTAIISEMVKSNATENINAVESKEINLNEGLYNDISHYIKVFEENKSFQMKIHSISKDLEEIEKGVKREYEQKLIEMKTLLERNKSQYESYFKSEFDRWKKEWTEQKMIETEEFVNTTKQQLEEKFSKCLQEEKNNVQSEIQEERENIKRYYESKINDIKLQYEDEKNNFNTKLRKSFQLKRKDEIKDLQQSHQNEIESLKKMFENKILAMENETRILKENLCKKSEDLQNLKEEFDNQKHTWEKEKTDFIKNEEMIHEIINPDMEIEKQLLRKIEKYHKYVSTLKTHYRGKVKELQTENEKLKTFLVDNEKELYSVTEQLKQQYLQIKKNSEIKNAE